MRPNQIRPLALGIFVHDGKILVFEGYDPADGRNFYRPLGGGIEFGERGHETLVREMREEIGAEVTNVRYLGLNESIFTHNGGVGHEIVLLYTGEFCDPAFYERQSFTGEDGDQTLRISWMPLADFAAGLALLVPLGLLEMVTQHETRA